MAQGLDAEMVRQHYVRVGDEELLRIIAEDGLLLTPEAKDIVMEEVRKRRLKPDVLPFVHAQLKEYSAAEIDVLCASLRRLPCTVCGQSDQLLNMTHGTRVFSLLVITNSSRFSLIACPDCMDKAMRKANIITALLGWWGLPWGIIRTIQALSNNISYGKSHHAPLPNKALKEFVNAHAGIVSLHIK